MTSSITDGVATAALRFTYEFRSTTLGIALVAVVLALIFAREMLKAHGARATINHVRALDIATWPLLLTFFFMVSVRLLELL